MGVLIVTSQFIISTFFEFSEEFISSPMDVIPDSEAFFPAQPRVIQLQKNAYDLIRLFIL